MLTIELDFEIVDEELFNRAMSGENVWAEPGESGASERVLIYSHSMDGESICPVCAQYLGQVIDGDEVPYPPIHPNCRCYSEYKTMAALGGDDNRDQSNLDWLKTLPPAELARVIGPIRAGLVSKGKAVLEDLYDENGKLVPLPSIGYDKRGRAIDRNGNPRKDTGVILFG